jgi:hypothetical protein
LKLLHAGIVKELQDRLDLERASYAEKEKALGKKLKGVEAELLETRSKASEELKATLDEAKVWAATSVLTARIKMAKEAAEPGFDKARWDVANWELQLQEFEKEDGGEGQSGGSGKKEAKVAEGGGVTMGNEDVMQV